MSAEGPPSDRAIRATLVDPYPEEVFTPLSDDEVKTLVNAMTETGIPAPSDRLHAQWARHLHDTYEYWLTRGVEDDTVEVKPPTLTEMVTERMVALEAEPEPVVEPEEPKVVVPYRPSFMETAAPILSYVAAVGIWIVAVAALLAVATFVVAGMLWICVYCWELIW